MNTSQILSFAKYSPGCINWNQSNLPLPWLKKHQTRILGRKCCNGSEKRSNRLLKESSNKLKNLIRRLSLQHTDKDIKGVISVTLNLNGRFVIV